MSNKFKNYKEIKVKIVLNKKMENMDGVLFVWILLIIIVKFKKFHCVLLIASIIYRILKIKLIFLLKMKKF